VQRVLNSLPQTTSPVQPGCYHHLVYYTTLQSSIAQYTTVLYTKLQSSTVQYRTAQYSTAQRWCKV